jgi:hypothetical protein
MGSLMDSIVIDRSYIHGTPLDETRRGVALVGSSLAVQDSYISDIHCNVSGSCVEAQAVAGAAPGPYKITDNFLEASAQSILFGGGIATQTPADIEISRNHMFKPLIWLKGQPGFLIETIVKNHVELKNAQRVLIDSNIMDNTWGGFSQFGFSVVITPKNQDLDGVSECPLCFVSDITVRYATISHVVSLFEIANGMTPAGGVAVAGERYSIHDVIGDDITGVFAQVSTVSRPLLNNVMINHVTAFPPQMMLNVGGPLTSPMPGFTLTNSILNAGQYPIWSTGYDGKSGCAFYDVPTTTMSACFANPVFSSNAILASPYAVSKWPKGNFFYTSSSIDFVNYNKGKGGDYHLQPTSPAVGAASDGSNLGANVDEVLTAISGVE